MEKLNRVSALIRISLYGRAIPIIALDSIKSFFKEKRFYIALLYYTIIPLILVIIQSSQPVIQEGTGIAIYYAQLNTTTYVKTLFLSFFPGQIFLIILSADQIAGEVEQETFPLLYAKPVFGSEIIIGKFIGILSVLGILEIPTLTLTYVVFMGKYKADGALPYFNSLDELAMMLIIVLLLQAIIIALAMLISSIFSRSLYAILFSILSLFVLSTFSDGISNSNPEGKNLISFNWLLDAVLPNVFFNLEPIKESLKLVPFLISVIIVISSILALSTLVLNVKELY